jgi:hypothetical protein
VTLFRAFDKLLAKQHSLVLTLSFIFLIGNEVHLALVADNRNLKRFKISDKIV